MNVHDIPMAIFTVITQMAVGTFIALGVVHLLLRRRHGATEAEHVVAPVLYAIGPVMVLGLLVSIFHVNDVTNIINVFRNWDSSWLSREILFGLAFAASGFAFAALEWFRWGSQALRQVVAVVTALLGLGLLWAEAMIYYSLEAVPAWHTWVVPFQFVATSVLLGVLAVGSAMMVTTLVRARAAEAQFSTDLKFGTSTVGAAMVAEAAPATGGLLAQIRGRIKEINTPTTEVEWQLTTRIVKAMAVIGAVCAMAIIIVSAFHIGDLAQGNAAAQESAAVLSGTMMWVRLVLVGTTAMLLGFSIYRLAMTTHRQTSKALATMVLVTMALALLSEFLGRLLHYESMFRVGL